jgi:cytidyltransferase-like protein
MGQNTKILYDTSELKIRKETGIWGMCDGVFDLMHIGHIKHLQNCKKLCDTLLVAVADDAFAQRKGEDRPFVIQEDRMRSIAALECVDFVLGCDGGVSVINRFNPHVYFRNADYQVDPELNPSILLVRMPVYGSTTKLIKKIRGEE